MTLMKSDCLKTKKKSLEYLSDTAQETAKYISDKLNIPLSSIKASTKNRLIVISTEKRSKFFTALEKLGFTRSRLIKGSSAGGVKKGLVEVIHKPASAQIGGGHGKLNELEFIENLQQYLQSAGKPLNITLTDGNRSYTVENITSIKDASFTQSHTYSKSDVDLWTGNRVALGVSIKKEGGARWESSKRRFSKIYENFLNRAKSGDIPGLKIEARPELSTKFYMKNFESRNYSKVIIENFPRKYNNEIVFGSKEDHPVIIAERDFSEEHFELTSTGIVVHVHRLYRTIEEVEEDGKTPVMQFSHHIGVANGIELRAFPEDVLPGENSKANVLYVPYDLLT